MKRLKAFKNDPCRDNWRGIAALSLVIASVLSGAVCAVMAVLVINHKDR